MTLPPSSRADELRSLGRLCLRLAAFLALVGLLQWGLARRLHWDRPEAFSERLAGLGQVQDGDVVYFGDSVLSAGAAQDLDARTLPTMLAQHLAPQRVTAIAHPAFQPELFAAATSYLLRSGRRSGLLLVPINLRAFSPMWALRNSWQFPKEVALLEMGSGWGRTLMRFRLAFKELPAPPPDLDGAELWRRADLRRLRARFPGREPDTPLWSPPGFTDYLRAYYLTEVGSEHPYLRALVRLGEEARQAGVPVVYYVTPLDLETMALRLGPPARAAVNAKLERFRASLAPTRAEFVDLSDSLPARAFAWKDDGRLNEHLAARGREELSRRLAERLRPRLESQELADRALRP